MNTKTDTNKASVFLLQIEKLKRNNGKLLGNNKTVVSKLGETDHFLEPTTFSEDEQEISGLTLLALENFSSLILLFTQYLNTLIIASRKVMGIPQQDSFLFLLHDVLYYDVQTTGLSLGEFTT